MQVVFLRSSRLVILFTIITLLQSSSGYCIEPSNTYLKILEKALIVSPQVKAVTASINVKKAELRSANLVPQAEIEFEAEEFGIDGSDFLDSEMTIYYSREIEPKSLRSKKRIVAESSLKKARLIYTNQLLLYIKEISKSYYEVVLKQMELDLVRETEELAKEMLKVAKNRVSAGAAPGLEQERSEMEYDMALIDVRRAEKELYNGRVKLASYLNISEDGLPPINENQLPPISEHKCTENHCFTSNSTNFSIHKKDTSIQLTNNKHPLLMASAESVEEARLSTEIIHIESKPVYNTTFGFRHVGETADNSFIIGVAIPLGSSRRNQSKIEAAKWLVKEEENNLADTKIRLTREIQQNILQEKTIRSEFNAIENRILPAAERIFQSVKEGYLRGELKYTDLLLAKQSLVAAAKQRVTALSGLRLAILDLEIAYGGTREMKKIIEETLVK